MATETVNQPDADGPMNLHDVYRLQAVCGYNNDLLLPSYTVQSIAMRLRAINAISAVLMAGESLDACLGQWMRSGLVDAVHALSIDTSGVIEKLNDHASKQAQATA